MKALLLAFSLLASLAGAVPVYDEDFSAYAVAKALTDNPPNFVTTGSSGAWVTAAGLSDKVAQNPTIGGANWAHAMYNGASYTYTDFTVRAKRGARANIFARVTSLSGVNSIPTDGYQVQVLAGSVILYKGGYATNLGSWSGDPSNINDFTVRLLCNGSSISVYVDGTLRIGPVTDATYSSGKVGIGTFASSTTLFTDLVVDDGTAPAVVAPGQLSPYIRQERTNFVTPLFLYLMHGMPYAFFPSSLPALEANTSAESKRNKRQLALSSATRQRAFVQGEVSAGRMTPTLTPTPITRPTKTPTPVGRAL